MSSWSDTQKPHPNSLLARCLKDPTLMARYRVWHKRIVADEASMSRWRRSGCSSVGVEEVG